MREKFYTDVYRYIDNLFHQWETILLEDARVSCHTQEPW